MRTRFGAWQAPPDAPVLAGGAVHIWRAPLVLTASNVHGHWQTLATDERERAARYYLKRDRNRFVMVRGVLRAILGRYLGVEPRDVAFRHGVYGKPMLAAPFDATLRFNVSRSGGLALYGVSCTGDIGVDLEHLRTLVASEEIAAQCFSHRERAALQAFPARLKPKAFFTCWTCKEAFVKARGDGLTFPLNRFDVSVGLGEQTGILSIDGSEREGASWWLRSLAPAPNYVAAVAVHGRPSGIEYWQSPSDPLR